MSYFVNLITCFCHHFSSMTVGPQVKFLESIFKVIKLKQTIYRLSNKLKNLSNYFWEFQKCYQNFLNL